ncbi:MAG: type 2 isopentenyl-diphosphate Delta-isomerase [Rhodospirillaceae bacterium]|nr:type 2 isopentenyl-diphosphate Delta-isomerase [Rhodospirillaceae bacterium]|tara:strand:+ start:42826 stop:43908 length:1083 start_codon:yes stop_codon:yes gene_type:complete
MAQSKDKIGIPAFGETETRKREHIETVLKTDVLAKGVSTGFEQFSFEHCAMPELDLDRIDLSTSVFGKNLQAPILISSMTGGAEEAGQINLRLAECAQELGLALGIGSQRAAIERPELSATYRVRHVAPDILLFANIGAVQLNYGYGIDQACRAVEMIDADALFIHLNPLQEAVQPEGDRNWSGLLEKLEILVAQIDVPVVVKEIGNGLSSNLVRNLVSLGVSGVDVAGAGGTSWSEVEANRQPDPLIRSVAHSFSGWGIPTAYALIEICRASPSIPVFASGGIRSGIDIAKAIRFGASLCGVAAPALHAADENSDAVVTHLHRLIEELRIAAFCTGSQNLTSLAKAPIRRANGWSVVDF